jgi:hypothetical protein
MNIVAALALAMLLFSCNDDSSDGSTTTFNSPDLAKIVSYCSNEYSKAVGMEAEGYMGAAIKLDTTQTRKGNKIIAVRIGLSTASAGVEGDVYISKRLKSNPLYTQHFVGRGTGWEYVVLDKPYTLNGNDTLCVSYKLRGKGQLIGYQETKDANANADIMMLNSQWFHLSDASITGKVCLQVVETGDESLKSSYDLSVGTVQYSKYMKYGEGDSLSVVVTNYGSRVLHGCTLTCSENGKTQTVTSDEYLPTGRPVRMTFSLPDTSVGNKQFSVTVKPKDESCNESNTANNTLSGEQVIYAKAFERIALLEQFTGQKCMYCPLGEESIDKVLNGYTSRVARVAHHIGFGTDDMTIDESSAYTIFYNSESTYAPAIMLNRTALQWKALPQPVFSPFDFSVSDLEQVLAEPAYVDVNVNNSYDSNSRQLTVKVNGSFITSSEGARLTVFLVQNKIVAPQENASKTYEHNAVVRACLSDKWGDVLSVAADGSYSNTYTYTIPEKIGKFDCDVNNMYIVAFVSNYNESDINDCKVMNAGFQYIIK